MLLVFSPPLCTGSPIAQRAVRIQGCLLSGQPSPLAILTSARTPTPLRPHPRTHATGSSTSWTDAPQYPEVPSALRLPSIPNLRRTASSGKWKIRPIRADEVLEVAGLQARAFHESLPLGPLDGLFYYVFRGEVLGGLQQKMKYSRDEGFCCLVAESTGPKKEIIGVVEVSVQGEREELDAMAASNMFDESYAYVACMAVDDEWRRQGVASDLLAHAEKMAGRWMQTYVLLHVFADNAAGVQLYERNQYSTISKDPEWKRIVGNRPRILMVKTASLGSTSGMGISSLKQNITQCLIEQARSNKGPS